MDCIMKISSMITKAMDRNISLSTKIEKAFLKIGLEPRYKKSYSMCGEDIIVKFIFDILKIDKPTFIDIGANHPYRGNNTFLLYKNGSRGINIEPNIFLWKKLKKHRKKDINLNIGISDRVGELDFYKISPNAMSTFSEKEAYRLKNEYGYDIEDIKTIKVDIVNNIINKYCNGIFPDFLSLDAEGLDEQILKSIDFERTAPIIIVTETVDYSPTYKENLKRNDIISFMQSKGYIAYADTMINTIFVKNKLI